MSINCDTIIEQADCIYDQLICSPKDQSAAIVIGLLACLISAVEAGGGGGGTTTLDYIWEECFQYLPDGEIELVSFTRRFTENLETHVVTTYDYDKLTGDPVVVPGDAELSVCPSCCDETNELLSQKEFLTVSISEEDASSGYIMLPTLAAGSKYQIRYLQYNNADITAVLLYFFTILGMETLYPNFYPQFGAYATRFNQNDYLELADGEGLEVWGGPSVCATVEYRIVPV